MKKLPYKVFPSEEQTLSVASDDIYDGAHRYRLRHSTGFNNGVATYVDEHSEIQFVQKNDDGSMTSGLQSEQLAFVLLDRCQKLNSRFPSAQNEKMIAGLQMFIDACRERVEDRLRRGVMGNLKK